MSEPRKRWISESLVKMLIAEMKDYEAAAEVVAGSREMLLTFSKHIGDLIAKVQERPAGAKAQELGTMLKNAREEINAHREWERDVLKSLPRVDDEEGLTGPLRQAFAQAAKVRVKLQNEVIQAEEKWLDAQAEAFRAPDESS